MPALHRHLISYNESLLNTTFLKLQSNPYQTKINNLNKSCNSGMKLDIIALSHYSTKTHSNKKLCNYGLI